MMSVRSAMLSDRSVLDLLATGPSIVVATVDDDGRPAACRAVALEPKPDKQALILYLPLATTAEAIANIASNGRVAVALTNPIDHHAVQIKGRCERVRVAGPEESELVTRQIEAFADTLDQVGLPRGRTRRLAAWPAFAVEVQIDTVFEQTPGPRAGTLVKAR